LEGVGVAMGVQTGSVFAGTIGLGVSVGQGVRVGELSYWQYGSTRYTSRS
jgi:hypothetical protein